ncbi:MAG: hypothetical protein B7X59_15265 [Polaromonas sp. 39-63-203]|uniref:hypothetical protein n=1 Tax=Polaromonas sp. TaxID=1869339 RepID=UPI000BD4F3B0|nr:hypothetical protein [Polaromonas sp.]OZA92862.1 MAG: hypothetical protein B7X59_15265 [Polaromonas sp. 39-63-203]HQS92021.1 hypothetical protein [Polaromonas sp.]
MHQTCRHGDGADHAVSEGLLAALSGPMSGNRSSHKITPLTRRGVLERGRVMQWGRSGTN